MARVAREARLTRLFRWLPFSRDLGLQVLALYLLFVGPVIAAALIFDGLASERLEHDVRTADLALAKSIALESDALLRNARHTVEGLAGTSAVQARDRSQLRTLFGSVMLSRGEVNLVYILDDHGVMVYHYPEGPISTVGQDFSFRPYFKDAVQATQSFLGAGRLSPTTGGRRVATAVMPLRDAAGRFTGLVATNLDLEQLSSTLVPIASDPASGLRVSILDATGQIIADSGPRDLLTDAHVSLPEETEAVLSGESASHLTRDAAGREWLRSYVPITSAGWGVVVQRPAEVAFASPRAFHSGLLIAIGVFLVGGLLFWVMLSRRVIAPIDRLAAFSTAISQRAVAPGDRAHLARLSDRPDQMGRLIHAFARMEQDVERRFAELATLLDTSTAVVSTLDSQRVLDTILVEVQRLLGVDTCAIVALDERAGEFRVRASRGLSAVYTRQLRILPGEPDSPSMRAIRSGQPVQVSDTETEPGYLASLRARARLEGYRALIAVPLLAPHAPPAALIVYWPAAHTCSPEELSLAANFANHAAMAIENAALFALTDEKLREQTRLLEAIVQSLGDGLILESPDGRLLYYNRRICELAGATPEEVADLPAATLRARLLAQAGPAAGSRAPAAGNGPEAGANGPEAGANGEVGIGRGGPFAALRASSVWPPAVANLAPAPQGEDVGAHGVYPPGQPGAPLEITLTLGGQAHDLRLQSFDVTDERGALIGRGQLWLDVTGDKQLDRMKSALIGTVSHELRTPLAAIKGNISSLLADDVEWDAAAQREFLEVALAETDRLSAMVSDLLDLSRMQAGTFVVHREPCALAALAARAAASARPAPGARLALALPADLPPVLADPPRVEAVLRNLIENAARYTPPDIPIRVSAEPVNGDVVVRVADAGPGIPAEHRARIFERFYRVDTGLARPSGGAGLGLAICKGFVEAHGGRIWLEPSAQGAVFAFTLPVG